MKFFVLLLHVGKANKEIRNAEPNIKEGTKIYDTSLNFSLDDLRLIPEYKLVIIAIKCSMIQSANIIILFQHLDYIFVA